MAAGTERLWHGSYTVNTTPAELACKTALLPASNASCNEKWAYTNERIAAQTYCVICKVNDTRPPAVSNLERHLLRSL